MQKCIFQLVISNQFSRLCLNMTTSQASQILAPNAETKPVTPSACLRASRTEHAAQRPCSLPAGSRREHVRRPGSQSCTCGAWRASPGLPRPQPFSELFSPAPLAPSQLPLPSVIQGVRLAVTRALARILDSFFALPHGSPAFRRMLSG